MHDILMKLSEHFFVRYTKSKSTWILYMVTLLLPQKSSKIGLSSFNVAASRFLMSPIQELQKRLPRNITISYWQIDYLEGQNGHRDLLWTGTLLGHLPKKNVLFHIDNTSSHELQPHPSWRYCRFEDFTLKTCILWPLLLIFTIWGSA